MFFVELAFSIFFRSSQILHAASVSASRTCCMNRLFACFVFSTLIASLDRLAGIAPVSVLVAIVSKFAPSLISVYVSPSGKSSIQPSHIFGPNSLIQCLMSRFGSTNCGPSSPCLSLCLYYIYIVVVVIRVLVARAPGGAQVLSAYGGRPGRPPAGCKRVGGSPLASLGVHGAGRLCGPGRPLPRGLHTVLAPGLNRAGASPGPPYYALSIRRLRQSATLTQHTHKHGGREYYTRSE